MRHITNILVIIGVAGLWLSRDSLINNWITNAILFCGFLAIIVANLPKENERTNYIKWSKAVFLALFISFFSFQYLLEFVAIYFLPGTEKQIEGKIIALGGTAIKDPNYKIKIQFSDGETKLWQISKSSIHWQEGELKSDMSIIKKMKVNDSIVLQVKSTFLGDVLEGIIDK